MHNDVMGQVARAISDEGGRAYAVGGYTRGREMGYSEDEDYDMEVFGLDPSELALALSWYWTVKEIGREFGVFQIVVEGCTVELSIPRKEIKTATGRRGFSIELDPFMSIESASLRRDFTCNAIYHDPLTGITIDHLNGRDDIKNKMLRACSPAFVESPDRVLRAMQLSSRLCFDVGDEVILMSRELRREAETIPVELRGKEWWKWACLSVEPERGLQFLEDVGWLNFFPILNALRGIEQSPEHHPEGDAWEHTKLAVKYVLDYTPNYELPGYMAMILFAALLHDTGKPYKQKGYTFHGHEKVSEEIAKKFCRRMGVPKGLTRRIALLVRNHMVYIHCKNPNTRTINRLAKRLHPAAISDLVVLMSADDKAKGGRLIESSIYKYNVMSKNLGVHYDPPRLILTGKILIRLGVEPGPEMGEILKRAFNAQLAGKFSEEYGAINWFKENVL